MVGVVSTGRLRLCPLIQLILVVANQRAELVVFRPLVLKTPPAQGGQADARAFGNLQFVQKSFVHDGYHLRWDCRKISCAAFVLKAQC